jgi:nucleotide-binding universal stress UspA family protein
VAEVDPKAVDSLAARVLLAIEEAIEIFRFPYPKSRLISITPRRNWRTRRKPCTTSSAGPCSSPAPQTAIRTGLAAHEIVEAARDLDSDLIVIATHGYTGWKHFCIGSTTERVVRTAPCPVFVVREKQHELI